MKKIPTLFKREYNGRKIVGITDEITPGCEEAFKNGVATIKIDGSCCAIIDGVFYKRYDAKKGKTPPEGAIPCCDPDPVTGHWPHWVKVDENNPADKWFMEAYKQTVLEYFDEDGVVHEELPGDGTYEAAGRHFNGNPYNLSFDFLYSHGVEAVDIPRTFDDIRNWLETHNDEGLVFWLDGAPVCKIKRTDFGLKWPVK